MGADGMSWRFTRWHVAILAVAAVAVAVSVATSIPSRECERWNALHKRALINEAVTGDSAAADAVRALRPEGC